MKEREKEYEDTEDKSKNKGSHSEDKCVRNHCGNVADRRTCILY